MNTLKISAFIFSLTLILLLLSGCDEVTAPIEVDAPANLSIEKIAENRVNLSWTYASQSSEIKYNISRIVGEGEWNDDYGESTANNFVDDIPTNSYTVYSYRVKAVSTGDDEDVSSFFSEPIGYFSPITLPTGLDINQLSQNELELVWEDNSIGETGYRIDRKIGDGNWETGYQSLPANSTYFQDTFGEMFVAINYRVYAYAGTSTSPKAELSFVSAYPQPENPIATQLSPTEITFSWEYLETDAEIIAGFEIYRKLGTSDWKQIATKDNTVREIIDVPQYDAGTLSYRLRAYKDDFYSSFSEVAEVEFNIFILGDLVLGNRGDRFILDGDRVLIANNYNGVLLVDVSNQSNPVSMGSISLPGRVISLYREENLLLAGNHNGKIFLIDLTEESSPALLHTLETLNPVYDLLLKTINGVKYIVAANGIGGLVIASYNELDPTDPKVITRHNTLGLSQYLVSEDNLVYLADGYNGVITFDIANPAEITIINSNRFLGNCVSLRRFGNELYVSNGDMGMKIIAKNSLQQTVHFDTQGYTVDIQPTFRYAYIADQGKGLNIVNIVDETEPYSQALIKPLSTLTGVKIQGSYAYILSENHLQIIQILP